MTQRRAGFSIASIQLDYREASAFMRFPMLHLLPNDLLVSLGCQVRLAMRFHV
ncbi:hypothetical protein [Aureliella helgolandensis]|uniref:hypothetical protein n=1 Tax=Aureliella helgolandensis TaxID=2527968 RepID=UPI0018D19D01|nr:hypothetical protein [Aureliella helgolandensis]